MLMGLHDLRATKSERSVDAESFIRAAKNILENEYGVKFYFCSKKDTGKEIVRLLKEASDE